jgi:hypothetical protein
MACDALAKFREAKRVGVAKRASAYLAFDRFAHNAGSGRSRLADLHMDDLAARSLARIRLPHDIHHHKRIDRAS